MHCCCFPCLLGSLTHPSNAPPHPGFLFAFSCEREEWMSTENPCWCRRECRASCSVSCVYLCVVWIHYQTDNRLLGWQPIRIGRKLTAAICKRKKKLGFPIRKVGRTAPYSGPRFNSVYQLCTESFTYVHLTFCVSSKLLSETSFKCFLCGIVYPCSLRFVFRVNFGLIKRIPPQNLFFSMFLMFLPRFSEVSPTDNYTVTCKISGLLCPMARIQNAWDIIKL